MKFKHEHLKGFRPFNITVTVETLDELYNLYARLNMSINDVVKACETHGWGEDVKKAVENDRNELFFQLLSYMPNGGNVTPQYRHKAE